MAERISRFVSLFEDLTDQRQEWKVKHNLVDIIFIVVVATIADCDDWEEIEWFAREKEPWFRKYLELPAGIPSHDTMQRVFSWLDPELFRQRFLRWTAAACGREARDRRVIAIDGKTMRGTRDKTKKALHVVNAWLSEDGMVLGQVFTDEKSNEITAIPELLDILSVAGHIVTIDAMGTQVAIAEKIRERGGDYVLAVKENQPTLYEDIRLFFRDGGKDADAGVLHTSKKEKGHGRAECRDYYVCGNVSWADPENRWKGMKSIGMARNRVEDLSTGKKTEEERYFISSLPADAAVFAYAVRQHWGVESMHWSLDMTFNEDGRRSRKDNSAKNLSQLNRLAYDILKYAGGERRIPLKRMRKKAMLNEAYLEQLVGAVFGV